MRSSPRNTCALRAPRHRADAVAHAPLAHHLAGELGGADEVVAGAGRDACRTRAPRRCGRPGARRASPRCSPACRCGAPRAGSCWVTPSAMPVGRIVTLWTRVGVSEHGGAAPRGRPRGRRSTSFSSSESAIDSRRCAHQHAVAGRLEVVRCGSRRAPRRTANSAASFTRLARSAPLMPGVPRATTSRSTSGPICLSLEVHLEDREALARARAAARRPGGRSGPGAAARGRGCRAGWWPPSSRCPRWPRSRPSRTSIWLSVCSRSSWPPPRPAPRLRPIESISSTKMIARPMLAGRSGTGRARGWRRRRRTSP